MAKCLLCILFVFAEGCESKELPKTERQRSKTVTQSPVPAVLTITKPGTYRVNATEFRKGFTVEVTGRDVESAWPEDHFTLLVSSTDGSVVAHKDFESSYGKVQIELIDVTGDGIEEFVFVLGFGHGASVRSERLVVERIDQTQFAPILSIPVSEYFGPAARWWYRHQFIVVNDIIDIRFVLGHDAPGRSPLDTPESIPVKSVIQFRWNAIDKRMMLGRSAERVESDSSTTSRWSRTTGGAKKLVSFVRTPDDLDQFKIPLQLNGEESRSVTLERTDHSSEHYDLNISRNGTVIGSIKNVFVMHPEIGTVDLDGTGHEDLFFVAKSGGSGSETKDLYFLHLRTQRLLHLSLWFDFNAANPITGISRRKNFDDDWLLTQRRFLETIKHDYGFIGEQEALQQERNPESAYFFWMRDNGNIQDGKLKLRRYSGKCGDGASVVDELVDDSIVYRAYFRAGLEAYDRNTDEHFIVFHPESMYDSPSMLRKVGPHLIFAAGKELVVFNVKTQHLKRYRFGEVVENLDVRDSTIRINRSEEIPFPKF